ncbi:MAG: lactonase family protein, partial [Chitinophagaceae bacterium]
TSSGKSQGIYVYQFNTETGEATAVSTVATGNPSYLAVSPDERFVYAVHETGRSGKGGEIAAFSFDKTTGTLTPVNRQPSGGDHPCYVEVDATGKWVFAGNYSSGSLSVFPVNAAGGLDAASQVIQHTGSGPDQNRQSSPHVHCTKLSPDNKWLFVPDLGIDKVMIYRFDEQTGQLSAADPAYSVSAPGAGPRHFTFHPNGKYAYLIEELSGHVVSYAYDNGKLKQLQRVSAIQADTAGYRGSADIHVSPDGKFLYATSRGDFNTITTYAVNADGTLTVKGSQSVLGIAPRNFNFDPAANYLLVANQQSDGIVIFKRNKETGALTDTGKRIAVGMPVCIKWMAVN